MEARKKILIVVGIVIAIVIVLRSGLFRVNAAILANNPIHLVVSIDKRN